MFVVSNINIELGVLKK